MSNALENDLVGSRRLAIVQRISIACAITVTLIGLIGLAGWVFDIGAFRSLIPGLVPMKANTAIVLSLLGLSLFLEREPASPRRLAHAHAAAWIATIVAGVTFAEDVFRLNLWIDEAVFRDWSAAPPFHPGRMAPLTALSLTMLGSAILLLDQKRKWARRAASRLPVASGVIGLVSIAGYLYSATSLYKIASYTSMALNTSVALVITATGILCSRPRLDVTRVLLSRGPGGALARRLLPIGLGAPLILGWIGISGQRAGYYGTEVGLGLMVIAMTGTLALAILATARAIDRADRDRRLAELFFRAQRLESLGKLAGGVAHDLNNLLLPVLMGVTLLKRLNPDEQSLKAIEGIHRAATKGADLVKRVLLFAGGAEGERTAVNLGTVVAEVDTVVTNTFPKDIKLAISMPQTPDYVIGDFGQLTQVLLTLCVNARDAMPEGGQITISAASAEVDPQYAVMRGATPSGSYVMIEVSDNGIGIPKEHMARIFDPFFTTKKSGVSTGLGLSTVESLLRRHGGFIDVSSEVGKGSTFRVYLPSHSGKGAGAIDPGTEMHADLENLPRGNGELILVVDDETAILDIARQTLEAFGYSVLTAENGAQAIEIYTRDRSKIAAVLTDMIMPVMDGAALIKALRDIDPSVPVIAASGRTAPNQLAEVKDNQSVRFLSKPYSAELMLCTLFQTLAATYTPLLNRGKQHV